MAKRKRFGRIPPPRPEAESARVRFSFKYLDSKHRDFPVTSCPAEYWCNLIYRIREYEAYTLSQFTNVNHQDDRHSFYFPETAYPSGFECLDSELRSDQGWQIKIFPDAPRHSAEAAWRAYGFLIGDMFYLVWLDLKHQLYPNNHPMHATKKKEVPKKKKR